MKCPACLSVMYNRDEIHKIAKNINRMNLHCWNEKCPSRSIEKAYGPYMQVITSDPNPWECVRYGLIVMRNDKPILLEGDFGYDWTITKMLGKQTVTSQPYAYGIMSNYGSISWTPTTEEITTWKEVRRVNFVQLDTGNDMHTHAHETMEKLTKLIAFM